MALREAAAGLGTLGRGGQQKSGEEEVRQFDCSEDLFRVSV